MHYYRALNLYELPTPKEAKIHCPTLIIFGTEDTAIDKEVMEKARPFVKGPLTIQYVEGASHWVQQDEPEKVNSYIAKFLQSAPTLRGSL